MDLSQNLNLQLKQKLSLSREMLLSLELIQLPLIDLKERIDTEILENPALELKEKNNNEQNIEKIEESVSEEINYFDDSSNHSHSSTTTTNSTDDSDLNRRFLEGAISTIETLSDHLLRQLNMLSLKEEHKKIGASIISLIDEDGFFKHDIEKIFDKKDVKVVKELLDIIQLFDPPGIATSGIQEALLFQIESMKEDEINNNAYIILKDHFELMAARKDKEIAKKMKISLDEVINALNFISKLNPYPGREFSSNQIKSVENEFKKYFDLYLFGLITMPSYFIL